MHNNATSWWRTFSGWVELVATLLAMATIGTLIHAVVTKEWQSWMWWLVGVTILAFTAKLV